MNLNRKLATTAFALTTIAGVAASANSVSALGGYDDGFRRVATYATIDVGVDYIGTRSVDVKVVANDAANDAYCTIVKAALYNNQGAQLGNDVTVGSVCGGRSLTLPTKSINTAAGDIASVLIWSTRGTGGASNGGEHCYRSTDSTNGNPHPCR